MAMRDSKQREPSQGRLLAAAKRLVFGLALCLTVALAVALAAAGEAIGQESGGELPPDLLSIVRNSQPSFLVRVSVDRSSGVYREGDNLSIKVASEQDAYVYVFYQPSEGKTYQIFPNRHQPNNHVKARQAVKIPGDEDFFRWVVAAPFGEEKLKVVATRKKVASLSSPELTRDRFNPVDAGALKGMELELGEEPPAEWAEDDVVLRTYPRNKSSEAVGSRRFGVFFGISKHQFAPLIRLARKAAPENEALAKMPDTGYDLFAGHRDAQKLAAAMQEHGRLTEARVFTNDRATRQAMEEAITLWLPQVSRPGDTVFLYFSGQTGRLPDANGDEPDGQDEFLVMHDTFGPGEVLAANAILERKQALVDANALSADEASLAEQLATLGAAVQEKHGDLSPLLLASGVSDDLLAHWLQRLAGRQVVLVCDTCRHDADENHPPATRGGDFLESELKRLRELGQHDQAVFCAGDVRPLARELRDKSMGVMTHFLVEQIVQSPQAVRMEEALAVCQQKMETYYSDWIAALDRLPPGDQQAADGRPVGAAPLLINHCSRPVYFKP